MQPHHDPTAAVGGLFLLFILFWLFCLFVAVAGTAFWVWMIVDCINNRRLRDDERPLWLLVVILGHGIGALVYFFTVRRRPVVPLPAYYPTLPPAPPDPGPAADPGPR